MDSYGKTVRNLDGKVEISFYEYYSDELAVPSYAPADSGELDDYGKSALEKLAVSERTPDYKYAFLDGSAYPDGTCHPLGSKDGVFPLTSVNSCDKDGIFSARPVFALTYPEVREVGRILLIGDVRWKDGPIKYYLNLYVPEKSFNDCKGVFGESTERAPEEYNVIQVTQKPSPAETPLSEAGKKYYKYRIGISDVGFMDPSKQCILLGYMYPVIKVELEIAEWNRANSSAKVTFFSDDIKSVSGDSELQSMSVLEEKTDSADKLSYGITSNSCTVKILNKDNRYVRDYGILQKNRIVKPYIREKSDGAWKPLGKFFSDSWEVPANSAFITCKSYDVLYNLQKMNLCYDTPYENGSYNVETNKSAYEIYEKIFALINERRKANGIYGADIKPKIDRRLQNVTFPYVCLGFDTAWNMLQTMANASQSFIFVDRDGNVRIVQDDFNGEPVFNEDAEEKPKEKIVISPSNSFSYNLPTMSHAIVNRVKVPYFTLETEDEPKDDDEKFTIEEKDFEYDNNGNVMLNISLKNFYPHIQEIWLCFDDYFSCKEIFSLDKLTVSYNQIRIDMGKDVEGKQYIKIIPNGEEKYKQVKADTLYDEYISQKHNGISEFELQSGNMIYGRDKADQIGKKITERYGNGLSYIETEWRGSPYLELGETVTGYSRKDETTAEYECLSNDYTYNGGLKVKAKAKAKKITASN